MDNLAVLEEAHRLTSRCAGRLVRALILKRATRRELKEVAEDLLRSSEAVRAVIAEERRSAG